MHVELHHDIAGVDPADALAWWSDFQPGHEDHSFIPGARRQILTAQHGTVEMRDEVQWLWIPVFRERVTAQVRGNTVQLTGRNTFARFRGRYVFEHGPEAEGTRIRLEATVELRGPLGWIEGLLGWLVGWVLKVDLVGHARDLQADLAAQQGA